MKYKTRKLTNNNELIYALKRCVFSPAPETLILSIAVNSNESSFHSSRAPTEKDLIVYNLRLHIKQRQVQSNYIS